MRLVLRETMLAFRRAPLLSTLSISTIAFSLFVFGLFGLVAVNIHAAIGTVAERVEVVAYLRRGTPIEATTLGASDIQAFPEVQSVEYVSEALALARARRELPEFQDIFQDLEVNPLPASLEVRLKPQDRNAATAAAVADRLKGFAFVEDVRFGNDWVQKLDRLRTIATAAGTAIGAAFALVAIIIIGNTIRMAVLHRSREIAIMRLVGATDGFIRRPFLLEGLTKGLLGGLLALALSYGAFRLVGSIYHASVFFTAAEGAAGVAAGGLLGLVGSLLSVGRHLRSV
ncbi:MAG TPA: permease-like cell division protein FtsX [Gemmatimonadales bacterium]|nr:permease-like cell division protein FtsX [Gemmatimonadales bacterium]